MTRRVLTLVATAAVLALAGIGLWLAGQDRPRSLDQRSDAIAAQLGCPTCEAQSVATSNSEIAAAMRTEISAQLSAGRTPDEVRAWFVDRYGPAVLLEPPLTGVGLVVWLVPAALLVAGFVLVAVVVRRRAPAARDEERRETSAPPTRRMTTLAVGAFAAAAVAAWLVAAGVVGPAASQPGPAAEVAQVEPVDPEVWMARGASLEAEQAYERSAEAYRRAVELRPEDVRAQVRLGLVLLKAGEPEEAESAARRILADRPTHPEGLLVLGLAQRAQGAAEATRTLRLFLDTAPTHPAAGEFRRLLDGS